MTLFGITGATGHRLAVTLLRNNFYADLLPQFADREGVLRGPAGEGRVAAVSRPGRRPL